MSESRILDLTWSLLEDAPSLPPVPDIAAFNERLTELNAMAKEQQEKLEELQRIDREADRARRR